MHQFGLHLRNTCSLMLGFSGKSSIMSPVRTNVRLRKLIWRILSIVPREMTLHTQNGLLTFNTRDRVLGKALYSTGNYEWNTIVTVMETLQKHSPPRGRLMLDIGANIGMISIACLRNGFFDRAMAFEPEAYNFNLLQRNVRQNQLASKIECFNCALSSQAGTLDLELSKDNFGDHRVRCGQPERPGFYHEEKRKTRPVKVMKLDDAFSANPDARDSVGLAWVDVQGHEGHFLKGARETIRKKIPVAIEFWPYAMERAGTSKEEFLELARDYFTGYFHITAAGAKQWSAIENLHGLFDVYRQPREMGTVLFV
jgi:FkbM family methyltransferase